ncbi:MAG: UTP--glucose-1-phosphate uridylyltransferase, partial [Lachnospira sp.]|nr:UTP--glucose-1-phosphate uridylyltransferase [Lachnospira sp.]
MNKQEIINVLKEHNQDEVVKRLEKLDETSAAKLMKQVEGIEWDVVESVLDKADKGNRAERKIEPLEAVEIKDIKANKEKYTQTGIEAIKAGKVAAVLLAGGQGTRLGLDKPKGTLNVGVNKTLYLFEQLINNLMDVVNESGAWVPLYIMTSDKNNDDTVAFFKEHDFFGYDSDYVKFFIQAMVPSVDYNGKLYMESTDSLAMSPNGNGGWFLSLMAAGLDKDMKDKGVEWVNVFAVDNILQRIADPSFVGATILSGAECGSKVVRKVAPDEKV